MSESQLWPLEMSEATLGQKILTGPRPGFVEFLGKMPFAVSEDYTDVLKGYRKAFISTNKQYKHMRNRFLNFESGLKKEKLYVGLEHLPLH
jgi:hypothetical protein